MAEARGIYVPGMMVREVSNLRSLVSTIFALSSPFFLRDEIKAEIGVFADGEVYVGGHDLFYGIAYADMLDVLHASV